MARAKLEIRNLMVKLPTKSSPRPDAGASTPNEKEKLHPNSALTPAKPHNRKPSTTNKQAPPEASQTTAPVRRRLMPLKNPTKKPTRTSRQAKATLQSNDN
jgi:hypothetical protein